MSTEFSFAEERSMFRTEALSPLQSGCLMVALDRHYRFDGVVKALRSHIEQSAESSPLELSESDGMISYTRIRFNRMGSWQLTRRYIARLKAKRCFYVNDWVIPIVPASASDDGSSVLASIMLAISLAAT